MKKQLIESIKEFIKHDMGSLLRLIAIISIPFFFLIIPVALLANNKSGDLSTRFEVYEDKEGGVTCYILDSKVISCMPTKDLIPNK